MKTNKIKDYVKNRWNNIPAPHLLIAGNPGSGKNFVTKEIVNMIAANPLEKVIIIDPYGDYRGIGKSIDLAQNGFYINPMDLHIDTTADKDAIVLQKVDFLDTLFEILMKRTLHSEEKLALCTICQAMYKQYAEPTLKLLFEKLQSSDNPHTKEMALVLEIIVDTNMNHNMFQAFQESTSLSYEQILRISTENCSRVSQEIAHLFAIEYAFTKARSNFHNFAKTTIVLPNLARCMSGSLMSSYLYTNMRRLRPNGGSVIFSEHHLSTFYVEWPAICQNISSVALLRQDKEDLYVASKILRLEESEIDFLLHANAGEGLWFTGDNIENNIEKFIAKTQCDPLNMQPICER